MSKNFWRLVLLLLTLAAWPVDGAEIPPRVSSRDAARLLQATEFVRGLDERKLIELVPEQSGLHFVGCPNCTAGRQENQLDWVPERPDEIHCRYCGHRYPSEKYPQRQAVTVRSPRGAEVRFPYWANEQGYRYFFQAHRDDEVRLYLAARTEDLAQLYQATGDKAHARRAAILLDRFAQVFPGWCYHYDYPFQQKEIYDGDVPPKEFRPDFRTARWHWWAYTDIPSQLVRAYDWIRDSKIFEELSTERATDVAARIERDLFRNAAEQVIANSDPLTNMSPYAWRDLIEVGRVVGEPRYVHEPVRRLRRLVDTGFFYDGAWSEGSPDYASQTFGGLNNVLTALSGYSDPPGYIDPVDHARFDRLDLANNFPPLRQARTALERLHLPNGRTVPIHDNWSTSKGRSPPATRPYLLPALGHACLGGGAGDAQTQFHLTWSGGYGHTHADNLSLLLFAYGREMLSDLGYTHTAYRAWTLATAAHNTVVIDGQNQSFGGLRAPSDGSLRVFDARDDRVQVVSADGTRGYPGLAKTYRRTLVVVDAGEHRRYAVDWFEVEGGRTHDYFLHGDADDEAAVTTDLELGAQDSLLPRGFDWQPTRNEMESRRIAEPHYAYGFLRNLKAAPAPADQTITVTFSASRDSLPALRVWLIPQAGSRLITGENPSIRQAGEDDARLDQFNRPFLALRHESETGRSSFVAVLEPYADRPRVTSVERIPATGGAIALRVQLGDRTDLFVFAAQTPIELPAGRSPATFQGDLGVMSLRGDSVEHADAWGAGGWKRGDFELKSMGPVSGSLRAIEADSLVVEAAGAAPPAKGDVVRLITDDGWVYPYTVAATETQEPVLRLRVEEGPGLELDATAGRLRLTAFPQREHAGKARVEWFPCGSP